MGVFFWGGGVGIMLIWKEINWAKNGIHINKLVHSWNHRHLVVLVDCLVFIY